MESTRMPKISRLIQKDLGEIIQYEFKHVTGTAMVTVTKVKVTRDMSIARIYLSIFASKDKEALLLAIRKQTKAIRHLLAQRTRHQLRVIPALEFYEDDSLDYLENIEKLLDED